MAVFQASEEHQSYPGRVHGGIATAILDETIGRAIRMKSDDFWGVTISFSTRFRHPVPTEEKLRVIGRIDHIGNRFFEGSGEILLKDGTVAVEGKGKFIKLPLEKIADFDEEEQEWRVAPSPSDPEYVEY
jgi:acyl-coenzyme A thioesterase PaaI-like protein